jgi:hypothetical protein
MDESAVQKDKGYSEISVSPRWRFAILLVVFRPLVRGRWIRGVSVEATSFRKYTWKYSFYGADPAIEHAIQQCELLPNPEWNRVPV